MFVGKWRRATSIDVMDGIWTSSWHWSYFASLHNSCSCFFLVSLVMRILLLVRLCLTKSFPPCHGWSWQTEVTVAELLPKMMFTAIILATRKSYFQVESPTLVILFNWNHKIWPTNFWWFRYMRMRITNFGNFIIQEWIHMYVNHQLGDSNKRTLSLEILWQSESPTCLGDSQPTWESPTWVRALSRYVHLAFFRANARN